jgi:hypothetical protein
VKDLHPEFLITFIGLKRSPPSNRLSIEVTWHKRFPFNSQEPGIPGSTRLISQLQAVVAFPGPPFWLMIAIFFIVFSSS